MTIMSATMPFVSVEGYLSYPELRMLIGGEWVKGVNPDAQPVYNPADQSVLGWLPHADHKLLGSAVDAAAKGFEHWRFTSANTKAELLLRCADLLTQRQSDYALLTTLEQGKPLTESVGEWDRVIETFRWHAQAVEQLEDISYQQNGQQHRTYSRLEPVGICAGFTAWNFPALLPARKIAPAIAAGCSMVIKASEETPASAIALLSAMVDAGLPDGVVNLVFGQPEIVSEFLLTHPQVRKCTFTGSVPVGKKLARLCADGLKRCTFELGGHAPVVVFEDADVEQAVAQLASFKYRNAGQACIAPSRFYIQRSIHSQFADAFTEYSNSIIVGNGCDPATVMGPMANSRRIIAMQELCNDAQSQGARCLTGNGLDVNDLIEENGHYWQPTIFADVPAHAAMMQLEPFGPISALNAFDDIDTLLQQVNELAYGLASYVFTQSRATADTMVRHVEAGGIVINSVAVMEADTPFGGVKESGYGYEGGMEGIDGFLHKKLVRDYLQ